MLQEPDLSFFCVSTCQIDAPHESIDALCQLVRVTFERPRG